MPSSTATLGGAPLCEPRNIRQAKWPIVQKESDQQNNALNQKSLRAAKMHDSKSISCADFMLHSVQMILYRLLRQAELVRNFLVRQPLRDQGNDLLLAPRQPSLG